MVIHTFRFPPLFKVADNRINIIDADAFNKLNSVIHFFFPFCL
nr:MAG TPA: hypothetical protein [Bacteriophage sp.]